MGQWSKTFRRYERHALLALVVLLLISFSITGALSKCSANQGRVERRLGGSFQATPTQREEVSDAEFEGLLQRFMRYVNSTVQPPTLDYLRYEPSLPRRDQEAARVRHAWMHVILARAAERAGYRCGAWQLDNAVKTVIRGMPQMGISGTAEGYDQFLRNLYAGTATDFEGTLREIVRKDEFLSPLADPVRFLHTQDEAYELWKGRRERVDLTYVAARAADFADEVLQEERTRRTITEQDEALKKLDETARRLKAASARLEEHRKAKGVWPATLAVLTAPEVRTEPWSLTELQAKDAWERDLVYTSTEAGFTLSSLGEDGQSGTPDDLTPDIVAQVDSHRVLARTAEGLLRWRNGAEPKAWPDALARLTEAPPKAPAPEGSPPPVPALPPLTRLEKDAWGSDLVYAAAAEGAVPALSSAGPDKTPGTADDIPVQIDVERVRVSPGPALAAYVKPALRDAWDRPFSITMRQAQQGLWEVASLGADGLPGTTDDVIGGSRQELETFYGDAAVREELREPVRREFEALVLHLPLVSDETLKALWTAFPEFHPTSKSDEDRLYQNWYAQQGSTEDYEFRAGTDPRDPVNGHGAAFARRMWGDAKVTLVPAKDVFASAPPAPSDPPVVPPVAPPVEPPVVPPAGEPAPAPAPAPAPHADPKRKEYEERGWREIVLRQEFLERLLNHFWQKVVASQRALKAWESAPDKITRRPDRVRLTDLLAEDKLGRFLPGAADEAAGVRWLQYVTSDGLKTSKELESLEKVLGDAKFATNAFVANTTEDEPAPIPIPLNERLTKVLFQNLRYEADRQPLFDTVVDQVFERYVRKRQFDRAERELRALQRDVEKRTTDRGAPGAEPASGDEALWNEALDAWRKAHPGVTLFVESTGLYVAAAPPRAPKPVAGPAGESLNRRAYVRDLGYGLVRPVESKQDTIDAKPGTFGRQVLRDTSKGEAATGCAYLVRVKDRVYPSKAEFSPELYSEFLEEVVFARGVGDPRRDRSLPLQDRPAAYAKALAPYFSEMERLQRLFDLSTHTSLDQVGGL